MGDRLCEPIFRYLRIRKVLPHVGVNSRVLDIGCGSDGSMLRALGPHIKEGIGIDIRANEARKGNISIRRGSFDGAALPWLDNSFDCVTLLAVLEHVDDRALLLREIRRVLKPGGALVITVPTWRAKPVLEFLAFRLKIVSEEGVREHKIYFYKDELIQALLGAGFLGENMLVKYFELGFNLYALARK